MVEEILEAEVAEDDFDASFYEDLGLNSLEKVAFIARVEAEFSVTLTDEEAASMTSLRSTVEVLAGKGVG